MCNMYSLVIVLKNTQFALQQQNFLFALIFSSCLYNVLPVGTVFITSP